jgi:hypothetical protein
LGPFRKFLATSFSSAITSVYAARSPGVIAIFIGKFDAGRFERSGADGASAFLDPLSHQLSSAGLTRFRRVVFRREPNPDAGRGTVCKLNTGRFKSTLKGGNRQVMRGQNSRFRLQAFNGRQ